MSRLSPKYIALALNAYIGWEGAGVGAEEALLDRAASRVLQMRDDPVTEYTFPSQVCDPVKMHQRSIPFGGLDLDLSWPRAWVDRSHASDCLDARVFINRRASP
jgi:hypothetical protein